MLRAELYEVLAEIHRRLPDMRFGQLICNLADRATGFIPGATWDVEDADLLATAKEMLAGLIENDIDHSADAPATTSSGTR